MKAENEGDKGTVAKVVEVGHTFDSTVIHKAKVIIYN